MIALAIAYVLFHFIFFAAAIASIDVRKFDVIQLSTVNPYG